ncbi:early nodulin-like protein 14 [Musa acuminata AAA Group]|uniref:early nodulin-like protein 14 n=1 Tax=Musa acuminata AAA Group TaxID=214697 RepID=UPI0031CE688F
MASSRSSSLVCIALLFVSITSSEARDFLVGGNVNAWRVPPTTTDSLNQWAEKNRFQVGDSLVWRYDAGKDSVLQVTREAYLSCKKTSPIAEHKNGATVVELHRSGAYYFISGAEGACEEGEKLIVVVMSERHSLRGLAPAPSPAEYSEGPAIAPTSGASRMEKVLKSSVAGALLVLGIVL